MNVFDFAMQMELDGKSHYEKLAAATSVMGLHNIFIILASDEQKHYDTIEAMKAGGRGAMASSIVLDEAKNVFRGLLKTRGKLADCEKTWTDTATP